MQIPYQAFGALEFCRKVQKEFKIPQENIICVGDELDCYFASGYIKSPDASHTPNSELAESISELKRWYRAFPQMKMCLSNHGLRWVKKAYEAGIPSQVLRSYKDLIKAPKGWQYKYKWLINDRYPFYIMHGLGYSGANGHKNAAIDNGISTIIGHLHAHAGIVHLRTEEQSFYGMNVGCLIDTEAYAFAYGKYARSKPVLGCGVVLDGGKTPLFIPY